MDSERSQCVICGRWITSSEHVDTCGKRCFRVLLERQRDAAFGINRDQFDD